MRRPVRRRGPRPALFPVVAFLAAACAAGDPGAEPEPAVGPRTVEVDAGAYAAVLHVSAARGSDEAGDGSAARPWASIGHALARITDAGPANRYAVFVAEGVYAGETLAMKEHVDLFGGFEPDGWRRDIHAHPTVLDGEGERRIAVGADHATLDGFVLRRGAVRGKGGALLLDGVSTTVSNNVFAGNTTAAPQPWAPPVWHETANDGGAIACLNGCSAVVRNNLFLHNTTEIGRGGAFACDNEATRERTAAPRVVGNVFIANTASAGQDTARSGDGGAVSFYGYCDGEIVGNVVAENEAANRNDGGGIFVALWAAPLVAENVIVGNRSGDDAGGLFVGGQKHHYGTPLDPVPPASEYFVRVERNVLMGNRNGAPSSGAFRITMMARGSLTDNITAQNPGGVHTERAELTLVRNTFLENARYEDDDPARPAPGPTVYRDNIITGERNWEAPVTEEGTCSAEPKFVDDGFVLAVASATYDSARAFTRFRVQAGHEPGALRGRVMRAGERWGVVRANGAGVLDVWGDFTEATELAVQPTYRLAPDSPCSGAGARVGSGAAAAGGDYQPRRINKVIELWEQGEPVYYASGAGGYEEGKALARTWADFIMYDMEHAPFDVARLREFMRGLVDGGPTPSGHRTPAVVVTLPAAGTDEATARANQWMVQQVLAAGVHGVHLVRARSPAAVRAFVQAARYPIHHQAEDVLGTGLRGFGSHNFAAQIWGIEPEEYLKVADVWPLNPEGEIIIGVKIEDPAALDSAEQTVRVPGIAFAEHGPRDMGLSYGYLEGRADPPIPPEVVAAGERVLAATRAAGIYFLDNVLPENVCQRIREGVMIGAGRREDSAEAGRRCTGRRMPW